ncbi:hypothetical protein [uncultured Victivallis sp.]|uniref:hypothetical protein n=1 Tax=uncultured Victivallis sp. TaxID=354118 RepID=UPI002594AD5C|nr:hypothetical protein [uncultured Victivallis sp.]
MQKHKIFTLVLLLGVISFVNAGEVPKPIKDLNQFQEFQLAQGMIYEIYVKFGDGVTTVTFPSAISKIAGVNVATEGTSDFIIAAKPGANHFNLVARKKGATGTLTVIYNRQTFILYLKQDDKKAYAAVNFAASSGGTSSYLGKSVSVTPARLLSMIDMSKGYELFKKRYPSELRDTIHAKNHRFFNYGEFKIELLEVIRFNREDTLVFKLLMHNESSEEIAYDRFSFSVQVGGKTYYMSAADASGIMPPKSATWAFFTITGTPDGRRNNLAPDNVFLIGVTTKDQEEKFQIQENLPASSSKPSDPLARHLNELADRLEKKLAELDKVEKNAENTQIKEEPFTSENDSRTAENENSEVSTPPASDMAAPVMDAVIPQSEAVVVPQGMSESDVMSPETPPQEEQLPEMPPQEESSSKMPLQEEQQPEIPQQEESSSEMPLREEQQPEIPQQEESSSEMPLQEEQQPEVPRQDELTLEMPQQKEQRPEMPPQEESSPEVPPLKGQPSESQKQVEASQNLEDKRLSHVQLSGNDKQPSEISNQVETSSTTTTDNEEKR